MPPIHVSSADGTQQQYLRREADCIATRIADAQAKIKAATEGITQFADTLTRASAQGDALSGILSSRSFNGALQQAKTAAQNLDSQFAACKSELSAIPDSDFGSSFPTNETVSCTELDTALASWQTALATLGSSYATAYAQLGSDQQAKAASQWTPLDTALAAMTDTATSTKDDLNNYISLAQGTCPTPSTTAEPSTDSTAGFGLKEQGIITGSVLGAGIVAIFASNHVRKFRGFCSEATSMISSGLKHVRHPIDANARKEESTRLFETEVRTLHPLIPGSGAPALPTLSAPVTDATKLTDATRKASYDVARQAKAGTPDPRTHISMADEKTMQRNLGTLATTLDHTLSHTTGNPTVGAQFQVLVGAQAIKDMPKDRAATALKCGAFDDHLTHDSALFGERWLSTRINRGWFGETTPGMERLRAMRAAVAAAEAVETVALINWHRRALISLENDGSDISSQCTTFATRVQERHLNPELVYDLLTSPTVEQARMAVVKALHGGLDNEFNTYVGDNATPNHVQTKRDAPEQAFAEALLPGIERRSAHDAWFGYFTQDAVNETFDALHGASVAGAALIFDRQGNDVLFPADDATVKPTQVRLIESREWTQRNPDGVIQINGLQTQLDAIDVTARIAAMQNSWNTAFSIVPDIANANHVKLDPAKQLLGLHVRTDVPTLKAAVPGLTAHLNNIVQTERTRAQACINEALRYHSSASLQAAILAIAAAQQAIANALLPYEQYVLPVPADFQPPVAAGPMPGRDGHQRSSSV